SGNVLAVGGNKSGTDLQSAELYDPASRAWTPTGSLKNGRSQRTATLLPSGRVLVVGGENGGAPEGSAELFLTAKGFWSLASPLITARFAHTATLLASGKVLVVGGSAGPGSWLSSAELYDPTNDSWT